MATKRDLVSLALMSILTTATMMFMACSDDDDIPVSPSDTQTVLIYMAGRNDLSSSLMEDFNEVKEGSKSLRPNDNLIVFVRNNYDPQPWVARIVDGAVTDSVSLSDLGIKSCDGQNRSSDPVVMERVLHYAFSHYPAASGSYGLVIGGHGSGWLMEDEVKRPMRRAALVDCGDNDRLEEGRWVNVPTLASILKGLPHLKFIMTDCCNMMCLENLYELRNVCDYMIGSPAEIPSSGAPYDRIVKDMFADGPFYTNIVDQYYSSVNASLPLVAVKTSEMENVARATRSALQAISETIGNGYPDMTGIIHYFHTDDGLVFHPEYNIFYDAGDFVRKFAPTDVYQQWYQALGRAIVEKRMATKWATCRSWNLKYVDFKVTEEKFHGVSMFVPQDPGKGNYARYNEEIKLMEWYAATN